MERTLWYAAWSGDLGLARELLAEGAEPDVGHGLKTPLMEAVDEPGEYFDEAHTAIVMALLDAGADVHARDEQSMTALHYAAGAEARATELLLRGGADPNATADDGTTPLHECATYGGAAVARALISAGADIARRNLAGATPLDIARREHGDPGEAPELLRLLGGG